MTRLQSAFDARGAAASDIALLGSVMAIAGAVIFVVVLGLLLYALLSRGPRRQIDPRWFVVGGGLVFPGVALGALLAYTLVVGTRLSAPPPADALTIDVTGYMWWWEVRYAGPGGASLATANELRIPVGQPVQVRVHSADVIHSFWVPNLAGKIDMIPGRINRVTLHANAPGTYRGQCAEFCGLQHTQMALHVVALPPDEWDAWFARRRGDAAKPQTAELRRGRRAFEAHGCGACHSVRGVSDAPRGLGPDLTHVGSRPSLAAGLLSNNIGNMVAWIAAAQALKPGSRMPSFHTIDGESLNALAAWLASLE